MNKIIIDQITESIDVVTEEKIKYLKFDSTKRGKVVSLYDNHCVVEIDGINYNCKIKDGINFNVNDTVFVKIPNNNFSDKYVDGKLGYLGQDSGGGEVSMMWADIIGKPNSSPIDIDDSVSKKHEHNNLTLLQTITQTLIDKWNSAWEHISDSVRHITSTERDKINSVEENAQVNQNAFSTITSPNQPIIYADTESDSIQFSGGNGINVANDPISKKVTISSTTLGEGGVYFERGRKKEELFIATEGQQIFNLLEGTYTINENQIELYLYGMKQPKSSFVETSASSIMTVNPLSEGTKVLISYNLEGQVADIPVEFIDGLSNVAISGEYSDLLNKPTIPSKTSQLTNDSNFETTSGSQQKANQAEQNAKNYTDNELANFEGMSSHGNEWHNVEFAQATYVDTELEKKLDKFNTLPILLESVNEDELLVYDSINQSYKKITKQNLLSGIANNDEYVFISHTEEFTASEGQTIFNLTKGAYTINADRISVYLYGMLQPPTSYIETSSTSVALKQGISEGTRIVIKYISVTNVMDYIHANNHAIGGNDVITPSMIGAEPSFNKNTAFNKNFGTTSNTIAEGNHIHTDLHSHNNKNILENITQTLIDSWNTVSDKVDKVAGKSLSSNDFTNALKSKLDSVESNANNYTHPSTHQPSIITQNESNRFVTDAQQLYWNNKQDALGFTPVNREGDNLEGRLILTQSSATESPLNIPHGTSPSTPTNGDIWTTTSGLLVRVNGTTRTLAHTSQWSLMPQVEAEGGSSTTSRLISAQRISQAIIAQVNKSFVENVLIGNIATHEHSQYVTQQDLADLGAGDMLKTVYDTNNNGKVDVAENAEQFAGQLPSYYTSKVYVDTELGKKVDKVTGKQLSTNDYTTTEKNKLANIESNANNYVHPVGTNPHGTTKSDVGLANILNYGVATQSEAQVGTSNVKYMTPLRTKEAIESSKMFYVGTTTPTNKNLFWIDTSIPINL